MKSEHHKHDKTNAIQLRAVYDIGVGIAKSFINSKSEEVFLWNENLYGKWPLDTKRKEVKSILKDLGDEESFQPWFNILQHHKEIQIIKTEVVKKDYSKWGRRFETLYTLSDQTQILYCTYSGMGGSEREWRIISTGRYFSRISYEISLPIFDGNSYEHLGIEGLGRLLCIKEPRYSQRKNMISYDIVFEKLSTLSQISISIFSDESFKELYVVTYFGRSFDIDDAEKHNYVKYIQTNVDDIYLSKYRESTPQEKRFG
jgi:hypothetical protein